MLTKGRIACRAVIEDWMITFASCRYWRLGDPFAAYTAAVTAIAFQWAGQPSKIAHSRGGIWTPSNPLFLGLTQGSPQTASRSV